MVKGQSATPTLLTVGTGIKNGPPMAQSQIPDLIHHDSGKGTPSSRDLILINSAVANQPQHLSARAKISRAASNH